MFYAKIEKEKMIFRQISAKSSLKINVYWDFKFKRCFTICHWVGWCQSNRINHVLNIIFFFITFIYEILEILENISANKDSMIGGLKRISDQYKLTSNNEVELTLF